MVARIEGGDRNGRDAEFFDERGAEGHVVRRADRRDVDIDEIGALARNDRKAARDEPIAKTVAAALTLSVPVIYSRVIGQRAFFAVQGVASLGSVGLGLWMLYRLILSPDGL